MLMVFNIYLFSTSSFSGSCTFFRLLNISKVALVLQQRNERRV